MADRTPQPDEDFLNGLVLPQGPEGVEAGLHLHFFTALPDQLGYLNTSMMKRAAQAGVAAYHVHPLREVATGFHRHVDDRPFGGGPGMVLKADIVHKAWLKAALPEGTPLIALTPQGRRLDAALARELAQAPRLAFLCGHYEGVDERVHEHLVTLEISIGDYVLTGGELAALVVADAVVRLLPGALGKDASPEQDSFAQGLLDWPHYTRPAEHEGWAVPEVLLKGDHAKVALWRRQEALKRTFLRRPDLLLSAPLSVEDRRFLQGLGWDDPEGPLPPAASKRRKKRPKPEA